MTRPLRNVAVDLTPVLPGGDNGGAKIFVLELVRRLAKLAPATQFLLLTQFSSHEELATLDRANVRRLMAIGPTKPDSLKARLRRVAMRLLSRLPARLGNVLRRLGYRFSTARRRRAPGLRLGHMGIDLLFCPFTAPAYFEPGIPTVCTIYDLQYKSYPQFFSDEDVAQRSRNFVDACRKASALTAISDYSRNSAIEHGNLDPVRIRTIHLRMGQRISQDEIHDTRALDSFGLIPKRYLVYPANFWKHKNHEMLLTAFGMACHDGLGGDIKLVCTGAPGTRQQWLKKAACEMGLGERVLFPGYLSNATIAPIIANSSGVVFPSLYEGFGLPVIEAMSLGVPVACSNTTSLPEVAADAAIFFDPRIPMQIARSILALVGDQALRDRLIEAGRQRATEFADSERMAREYWDLFQFAVANHRREDMLTGVYDDGWIGPSLYIQVAPSSTAQSIELELSAPEWLPPAKTRVQASHSGTPQVAQMEIVRGSNSTWSIPVERQGASYFVRVSPTFIPAESGLGFDSRELSLILGRCRIRRNDGPSVELFPDEVSK
jgi:glycosyltransferase involved in cell wall biosynthesis